MIASLRGTILAKDDHRVIIEAGGVGYEVHVTAAGAAQLPEIGGEALLYISESFGMYGGGASLYGFPSLSDKAMFETFRDKVPSTGAKKALEYLERASKSLPDFRRAVIEKDHKLLTGVFGFSKKTAERLVESLKDGLDALPVPGIERLKHAPELPPSALSQALNALAALGYKPSEAKAALQAVAEDSRARELPVEQILRLALKRL